MVNPPDPIFPPTNTLNSNALSRHGRHERDVLRFGVGAVIEASGDRDVQFARKVRKPRRADARKDADPFEGLLRLGQSLRAARHGLG